MLDCFVKEAAFLHQMCKSYGQIIYLNPWHIYMPPYTEWNMFWHIYMPSVANVLSTRYFGIFFDPKGVKVARFWPEGGQGSRVSDGKWSNGTLVITRIYFLGGPPDFLEFYVPLPTPFLLHFY